MEITIVYHWTAKHLKKPIIQTGIKPFSRTQLYENPENKHIESWSTPYIYTSLDPKTALSYVRNELISREFEEASLFQIKLTENDDCFIRMADNKIVEVRIRNTIPADRVFFIGDREL